MKKLNLIGVMVICALSSQAQSTNGLIAHWNFNGNANDNYGTHHGMPYGVSPAAGKSGLPNTAYYFSDTVSYITVPYQSDMNLSQFSITTVLKVEDFYTGTCQGNYILSRGYENTSGNYGSGFFDNAYNDCFTADTDKYVFYTLMNNGPAASPQHQYSPNIKRNQWYCVTAWFNGQELRTYVDGVLKSTQYPTSTVIGNSTDGIIIGRYPPLPGYPYQFNGYIDDIKLYNRALADSEIVNFCNSVDTTDTTDTTGNNDTTLHVIQPHRSNINLYPNPNRGDVVIAGNVANNEAGNLSITNAVGQIVYSETIVPVNYFIERRINLSGKLAPGIYIVQYKTRDYSWTRRMTVKE